MERLLSQQNNIVNLQKTPTKICNFVCKTFVSLRSLSKLLRKLPNFEGNSVKNGKLEKYKMLVNSHGFLVNYKNNGKHRKSLTVVNFITL